ncbi:MAG: hypothetical protein CK548_09645 [Opitutia bacterium]|nr:MAG: hypothetical protein CK548_09645 [Opitutae bacterium]
MPGKLIERLPLGIPLALYNLAMLVRRDGALFLEADNGPLALGHQRPRQPVHIDAEIVQTPEIDVRGDRAGLKHFEHELGRSLGDDQGQQRHVGFVFRRALPARPVRGALHRGQRGQGIRPRALGDAVVRARQIRFGELEIQGGLLLGLILGVDDLHGGPTVGRVEAGALTQAGVVAVELSSSAASAD